MTESDEELIKKGFKGTYERTKEGKWKVRYFDNERRGKTNKRRLKRH